MIKNKTAIVDIDNILWHFCDALHEELRKINKRFPSPRQLDTLESVGRVLFNKLILL